MTLGKLILCFCLAVVVLVVIVFLLGNILYRISQKGPYKENFSKDSCIKDAMYIVLFIILFIIFPLIFILATWNTPI